MGQCRSSRWNGQHGGELPLRPRPGLLPGWRDPAEKDAALPGVPAQERQRNRAILGSRWRMPHEPHISGSAAIPAAK